jgi:hypothetical protein
MVTRVPVVPCVQHFVVTGWNLTKGVWSRKHMRSSKVFYWRSCMTRMTQLPQCLKRFPYSLISILSTKGKLKLAMGQCHHTVIRTQMQSLSLCSLFVFSLLSVFFCFFLPIVGAFYLSVFFYLFFPSMVLIASQYHGGVFPLLLDLQQKLSMQACGCTGLYPL